MIRNSLRPVSSKHSIREAVISLFLSAPINEIELFKNSYDLLFSDDFQQHEAVNEVTMKFRAQGSSFEATNELPKIVGFKLTGIDEGKIKHVLQGKNEVNRSFLSYHSLSYTRWNNYLESYLTYLDLFASVRPSTTIKAISVHYIDEFRWIDSINPIETKSIFNEESVYLNKAVFDNTIKSEIIYLSEKSDDSGFDYFERLEIKIDNKGLKNIVISHNTTTELKQPKLLSSLLKEEASEFNSLLLELHKYNKKMLRDILTSEVKKMINLPISDNP